MNLRTRIFIIFLVIATIFTGGYCFISAFYAPFFFRDTFHLSAYISKSSTDDIWEKNLSLSSSLFKMDARGKSYYEATPADKQHLKQMLNDGWEIIHSCRFSCFPVWISQNSHLLLPESYSNQEYYFKTIQQPRFQSSSPMSWSLIIPNFDCELAFVILPTDSRKILFYPTGMHRNEIKKLRQKYKGKNNNYTRIDIPPLDTLRLADSSILEFMNKDMILKNLQKQKNNTTNIN